MRMEMRRAAPAPGDQGIDFQFGQNDEYRKQAASWRSDTYPPAWKNGYNEEVDALQSAYAVLLSYYGHDSRDAQEQFARLAHLLSPVGRVGLVVSSDRVNIFVYDSSAMMQRLEHEAPVMDAYLMDTISLGDPESPIMEKLLSLKPLK